MPQLPGMYCFLYEVDGTAVSAAISYELPSGDCTFYFVATAPEFQGRGFGLSVMQAALHHAKQNGCTTATLQSSKHGPPLYLKLGLRDLGNAVNLWERQP
jgi:ribosomal protein S18 acetylase RimI-like enzyme